MRGRDSVLGEVARRSHCHGLHPVLFTCLYHCRNHLERTGTLISISLQLFFFPPRPIFYLLAFMPMRNFLNDQFLLLCIFRKAVSLPHGKHDLSVFSVLYFSLVYFRHPVSCHCSEPPRLETAPSRDLERKGHFPSPASPIIMFVM